MTPKQKARVYAKLIYAESSLKAISMDMYMCKVRDAYAQHRKDALKEMSKIKPLLTSKQLLEYKMLVAQLHATRTAPRTKIVVDKCKLFAQRCADAL